MVLKNLIHSWWGKVCVTKFFLVLFLLPMLMDFPSLNSWGSVLLTKIGFWDAGESYSQQWIFRREMDYADINRTFEGIKTDFPADLLKAIAWCESEWQHWDQTGQVFTGVNYKYALNRRSRRVVHITYDYGIMQINNHDHCLDTRIWDPERVKNDPEFNIRAAVEVLKAKRRYVHYLKHRPNWKQLEANYDLAHHSDLEITLKAYNGFKRSWNYTSRVNFLMVDKPWEKMIWRQLGGQNRRPEVSIVGTGIDTRSSGFFLYPQEHSQECGMVVSFMPASRSFNTEPHRYYQIGETLSNP